MSILNVRGLKKRFGHNEVLKGVDLSVEPGEVTFLIGPSGGGKTTLLRCLNFLEMPDGGTIEIEGQKLCQEDASGFRKAPEKQIRQARSRMPMVFQHFNLWNHRTALENVIEGPIVVQKRSRSDAIDEGRRLLERVGLKDKLGSYPAELSGGQKQRVGIARALAMQPTLLLCDEPTSSLDPELVSGILDLLRVLADEGRTMVVVSHEMGFARRSADRVHFVDGGRIAESGPPETIFNQPETERLKSFISAILH
ncbi:MAG: amino acid ABC transporter ATP-binding protein [Rhodospirillaceae bacterium]|nr:amino acid ABC transporter ATP-binding protein [Rhodospirillaceae bacterium]